MYILFAVKDSYSRRMLLFWPPVYANLMSIKYCLQTSKFAQNTRVYLGFQSLFKLRKNLERQQLTSANWLFLRVSRAHLLTVESNYIDFHFYDLRALSHKQYHFVSLTASKLSNFRKKELPYADRYLSLLCIRKFDVTTWTANWYRFARIFEMLKHQ